MTAHAPANRLGLDYFAEAQQMGAPPVPIIDAHAHINGVSAVPIYRRAMDAYGVESVWTMTKLEECEPVRELLDDRVHFIAVPNYWGDGDLRDRLGPRFLERIEAYHAIGSRIVKFWAAPRGRDYAAEAGDPTLMLLENQTAAMQLACDLDMVIMTHVADPDTWFKTKYADSSKYGTKRSQYEPLEALIHRFPQPWMAAHLGGWPEDLEFLSGLLDRHPNLHLDSSATKWMVRELSRHSRADLVDFLKRYEGRILFGSDIVTADEHLTTEHDDAREANAKAGNADEAFDLYASRYWALRTLYETTYDGESPIADPDLALVDPDRYDELDAPPLIGKDLPEEMFDAFYRGAAQRLLAKVGVPAGS